MKHWFSHLMVINSAADTEPDIKLHVKFGGRISFYKHEMPFEKKLSVIPVRHLYTLQLIELSTHIWKHTSTILRSYMVHIPVNTLCIRWTAFRDKQSVKFYACNGRPSSRISFVVYRVIYTDTYYGFAIKIQWFEVLMSQPLYWQNNFVSSNLRNWLSKLLDSKSITYTSLDNMQSPLI